LPVVVTDNFSDVCSPSIERSYDPQGGPGYDAHGDYLVTVTASDPSENRTADSVPFTIDTAPPLVRILSPSGHSASLPGGLPFTLAFEATDDDGAAGKIVHERTLLDGCVTHDGRTYGDGDGLLSDETIELTVAELCRIAARCGFTNLHQPEVRVEALDCGGNLGFDTRALPGSLMLVPGICGR
jgi:hypothetical protein